MDFGIVGVKSLVGLKSKKSGQDMNAYILQMVRDNPRDDRLEGVEVKQQFVSADLLAKDVRDLGGYSQLVGMRVDITYDDGGFVDSIEVKAPVPANK